MERQTAFVTRAVLGLTLLLIVVACGAAAPSATPDPAVPRELDGTAWAVASIDGTAPGPDRRPTVIFDGPRVEGSGGCNQYGGDYAYDPGTATLTVGDVASTMMGCKGPEGAYEGRFHTAFRGAMEVSMLDDQLLLRGPGGVIVLDAAARDESGS